MLKQRRAAAEKVAKVLHGAEAAVDGALVEAAALVGTLPVARMEAGLAATIGQEAIERAMEALGALTEARAKLVAAHEALYEVQQRMGLRELNFGALGKPAWPPAEAMAPKPATMRLAA